MLGLPATMPRLKWRFQLFPEAWEIRNSRLCQKVRRRKGYAKGNAKHLFSQTGKHKGFWKPSYIDIYYVHTYIWQVPIWYFSPPTFWEKKHHKNQWSTYVRKCVSHRITCRFLDVFYKQCSKHVRALTVAFQNCRGPVKKTIHCLMAPMATYRFLQSPYTLATKYLRKCIGPQWKSIGCLMARVATYRL